MEEQKVYYEPPPNQYQYEQPPPQYYVQDPYPPPQQAYYPPPTQTVYMAQPPPSNNTVLVVGGGPIIVDPDAIDLHRAILFYWLNIVCCILSLVFWVFVIIPLIVGIIFAPHINRSRQVHRETSLFVASVTVTIICGCIWLAFIVVCAVFSFGICLILIWVVIPYFVIVSLHGATLCGIKTPNRFNYNTTNAPPPPPPPAYTNAPPPPPEYPYETKV